MQLYALRMRRLCFPSVHSRPPFSFFFLPALAVTSHPMSAKMAYLLEEGTETKEKEIIRRHQFARTFLHCVEQRSRAQTNPVVWKVFPFYHDFECMEETMVEVNKQRMVKFLY